MSADPYMSTDLYMGLRAPALTRGLDILELLAQAPGEVPFSHLLERTGMPRATLIRLLAVLRAENWIVRSSAGHAVGPRWQQVRTATTPPPLTTVASAVLADLVASTGCSAVCFAWSTSAMTVVAKQVHPAAPTMQEMGARTTATSLLPGPWWWVAAWRGWAEVRAAVPRSGSARRFWSKHAVAYDDAQVLPFVRRLAVAVTTKNGQRPRAFLGLAGNALLLPDRHLEQAAIDLSRASAHMTANM